MLCPTLAAYRSLSVPSKIENHYFHLPVSPAGQPAGWREGGGASDDKKTFLQEQLENDLFTLFEKVATNVTHC